MTGHGLIDRESAEVVFLRYAPLFESKSKLADLLGGRR